ncbi:hypothetical protein UlMin_021665 [Ulmus minor]
MDDQPHVAILPSPGMGHLIPLVELAKRLVRHHGYTVTFVVPTDGPPTKAHKSVLEPLPSDAYDHVFLPPVNFDDLPENSKIETLISLTVARSLDSLREFLKSLISRKKLVSLVVDLFATDAFDVAREFNISPYIFFPSSGMALSLFLHLPELDEKFSVEYRELPEVKIPGCTPIPGKELLDPVQDRKNEAYKWVLHHTKRYRLADGVLANTFKELEPGATAALQEREPGKPPVYLVGPLVNVEPSTKAEELDCLKWLDEQPHGSVLFVSFGSGGTLSTEQINELALGLEMSEQRFLWVVKRPNDSVSNATYFKVDGGQNDKSDFLPNGFLERTKSRGFVVTTWAPQVQILSHSSTGGFLSHCGWNSTLESVVNGVPIIAWPLFAEQKMNAFLLTQESKLALRAKANENGIIGKEEIAKLVKALIEGEEGKRLRNQMKDLKEAAKRDLGEGGSSFVALSEVATKWKNQISN